MLSFTKNWPSCQGRHNIKYDFFGRCKFHIFRKNHMSHTRKQFSPGRKKFSHGCLFGTGPPNTTVQLLQFSSIRTRGTLCEVHHHHFCAYAWLVQSVLLQVQRQCQGPLSWTYQCSQQQQFVTSTNPNISNSRLMLLHLQTLLLKSDAMSGQCKVRHLVVPGTLQQQLVSTHVAISMTIDKFHVYQPLQGCYKLYTQNSQDVFKKAIRHQCVQQSTPNPVASSKVPGKLLGR